MTVINSLTALYEYTPEVKIRPFKKHSNHRSKKRPGDGTLRPDKWGHWRRGKPGKRPYGGKKAELAQKQADYNRVFKKLEREHEREVIEQLERLYPTPPPPPKRERSALQKLAYAFYLRQWDSVRNIYLAAIQEAENRAILQAETSKEQPVGPAGDEDLLRIDPGIIAQLRETIRKKLKGD